MKNDFTGVKIGELTGRCIHSRDRNGHIKWLCDCSCGGTHIVLSTHLVRRNITHCGCKPHRGSQHKQWTGFGEISGNKWNSIKRGANGTKGRREIDFNISIEYAWELFLNQNRKCALSGLDIWFPHTTTFSQSCTASMDRINSGEGVHYRKCPMGS